MQFHFTACSDGAYVWNCEVNGQFVGHIIGHRDLDEPYNATVYLNGIVTPHDTVQAAKTWMREQINGNAGQRIFGNDPR